MSDPDNMAEELALLRAKYEASTATLLRLALMVRQLFQMLPWELQRLESVQQARKISREIVEGLERMDAERRQHGPLL
jgi:hypothetical protein